MDLLWIGGHLVVAGPDRSSFLTSHPEGARYAGLRFAPGLGPSVFGVPATPCAMSGSGSTSCGRPPRCAVSRNRSPRRPARYAGWRRSWPATPGTDLSSTRCSPTSFAAPAVATGSHRSRRRSGCRRASCSAGPSRRSATGRSCWRASCASATRWTSPGEASRSPRSPPNAATPIRRTWRTTCGPWPAPRSASSASACGLRLAVPTPNRSNWPPPGPFSPRIWAGFFATVEKFPPSWRRRGGFSDLAAEDFGDPADSRPGVLARAQGAVDFRVSTNDGHGEMR